MGWVFWSLAILSGIALATMRVDGYDRTMLTLACAGLVNMAAYTSWRIRPWRLIGAAGYVIVTRLLPATWRGLKSLRLGWQSRNIAPPPPPPPSPTLPRGYIDVIPRLREPAEVVLGIGNDRIINVNLLKAHTLVGGSTGAGKTNLLNGLLMQLIARCGCDVFLIDMKCDIDDGLWQWQHLTAGYATELEDARTLLANILNLMEDRNRGVIPRDRPVIVVIDELAELSEDRTCQTILRRLAQKGRGAGVLLVAATQYPKSSELDTAITRNLMRKVCLITDNATQAQVILNDKPPYLLREPGEFWLHEQAGQMERGRAFLVRDDEINSAVWEAIQHETDPRMQLLARHWTSRAGVNRMAKDTSLPARWVEAAYRNYVDAGIFTYQGRGHGYEWTVNDLTEGLRILRGYIAGGQWVGSASPGQ